MRGSSKVVRRLGGDNSDSLLKSQKLPAGADPASSPHVVAPVERVSVESQLESDPANGKLSGQAI